MSNLIVLQSREQNNFILKNKCLGLVCMKKSQMWARTYWQGRLQIYPPEHSTEEHDDSFLLSNHTDHKAKVFY